MAGFVVKKLGRRRSLGSILKSARTKLGATLETAEAATRIHPKYLRALEEGKYRALPSEAYNIGFIRCYAVFLRLKPEKIISLYRQERSAKRLGLDDVTALAPQRVSDWNFLITPKFLGFLGMMGLFGSVLFYIGFQLHNFAKPPSLTINSIPAEFTSSKDTVTLSGTTDVGTAVSINAEPIVVGEQGQFSQNIQLTPGINEILVAARNRAAKEAHQTVKVLYNPNLAKVEPSGSQE